MPTKPTKAGFLAALLCSIAVVSWSQYSITVEASEATSPDLTRYRVYVNMMDPADRLSAIYGTDTDPLSLAVPNGAFNSPFNSSWNASGVNPAFLTSFPSLADDSYATVGLTGPASTSSLPNAEDPSLVEDSNQPITPFFLVNGSTQLLSNTLTGASWFVLNTASNGLPDINQRVLALQVTTAGDISGQLNFQVFPLGLGDNAQTFQIPFAGTGTFFMPGDEVLGCTDDLACNYNPSANANDGSCEYCNCDGESSASLYSLNVDVLPSVQAELNRYVFRINMNDASDTFSAVYGNEEAPLLVEAPSGVYNSNLNAGWNASGINPLFLSSFPEMADDTYATIGLTGPASTSGIPGAADPSLAQDPGQPIAAFFTEEGATVLAANQLVGSSWFVLNDAGNAAPDDNLQVLVLQVSTPGSVSGQINVQVFPNGNGDLGELLSFAFDGIGTFSALSSGPSCGCTDSNALNYDPEATYDDGSCEDGVPGCTDSNACNYNPTANVDDDSCAELDECGICGGSGIPEGQCDCDGNTFMEFCLDVEACNYEDIDMCALNNPDLCEYEDALGVCGGLCTADEDQDGICDDIDPCVGDPSECCSDYNQNGLCDATEVVGCTFASAPNYNPEATMDNGTCVVSCLGDLNGDGHIQLSDMLDFLMIYGLYCD